MPEQFLASIFSSALSLSFWKWIYQIIRILFLIADAALLLGLLYLLKKSQVFYPPFVSSKGIRLLQAGDIGASRVSVSKEWESLRDRFKNSSDDAFPLFIIEADKLVDDVLKQLGFSGDTMLERLQRLVHTREIKTLEPFWRAHKVRNNIAHTPNYRITREETNRHLEAYQAFLRELRCL